MGKLWITFAIAVAIAAYAYNNVDQYQTNNNPNT